MQSTKCPIVGLLQDGAPPLLYDISRSLIENIDRRTEKMQRLNTGKLFAILNVVVILGVLAYFGVGCGEDNPGGGITSPVSPPPLSPTTGIIKGQLIGRGINPSGSTVVLTNINLDPVMVTTADNNGRYALENIAPGQYHLLAYLDIDGDGLDDDDPFGGVVDSNGLAIISVYAGASLTYDFTIGYYSFDIRSQFMK